MGAIITRKSGLDARRRVKCETHASSPVDVEKDNAEKSIESMEGELKQADDLSQMQTIAKQAEASEESLETMGTQEQAAQNDEEFKKDDEEEDDLTAQQKIQEEKDQWEEEKSKLSDQQLADGEAIRARVKNGQSTASQHPYAVAGNGVEVCEKQDGLGEAECNMIVCCQFDDGKCKSKVGEESCSSAETDESSKETDEDLSGLTKDQLADRKWNEEHKGETRPVAKANSFSVEGSANTLCGSEFYQTNEEECNALICCNYEDDKCVSTVGNRQCNAAEVKEVGGNHEAKYTGEDDSTEGLSKQQIADRAANTGSPAAPKDRYAMEGTGKEVCESTIAEMSEGECKALVCCTYATGMCRSTVGNAECSSAEKDDERAPTAQELAQHPEWSQHDDRGNEDVAKGKALTKKSPTGTGEEECVKVAISDASACAAVGCCNYEKDSGECNSAVGTDKCVVEEVHEAEKKIETMEAELHSAHSAHDLDNVLDKAEEAESQLQSADHQQFAASKIHQDHQAQQSQQTQQPSLRSGSTTPETNSQAPGMDPMTIGAIVVLCAGLYLYYSNSANNNERKSYQRVNSGYQDVGDPSF